VIAAFAFVFPLSLLTFYLIKKYARLRISAEVEEQGIDMTYHGVAAYPEFAPEGLDMAGTPGAPKAAGTPVAAPVATGSD